jgi:hypothetical protein
MRAGVIGILGCAMGRRASARPFPHNTTPIGFTLQVYLSHAFASEEELSAVTGSTTVFYTPEILNSPRRIEQDIHIKRHQLRMLAVESWLQDQRAQYQAWKKKEALLRPKRIASPTKQSGNVVQIYESAIRPGADVATTYG